MSGKAKAEAVDLADLVDGRSSRDVKLAPIVLPAGSYDMDELQKGLGAVSRSSAANRDKTLTEALAAAAAEGTVLEQVDPASQPGHQVFEVENEDLGITETLRVYVPEPDEAAAAADPANTKE